MIELGLDWSSVWYSLWWLQERYAWLWSFVYIDQAIQAADISHRCSIWSDSDELTSSADVISSKASATGDRITIWYFGSTPLSGQCWKNWCWNFSPPGQRNSYMCFSSSHMCVMNHNWSARKQLLHLQSVAGISCYSALSEDRIRQCWTSSGSRHKDTDQ